MLRLVAPFAVIALLDANPASACDDDERCSYRRSQATQPTSGQPKLKSNRGRVAPPTGGLSATKPDPVRTNQRSVDVQCKRYLPAIGRVISVPCV